MMDMNIGTRHQRYAQLPRWSVCFAELLVFAIQHLAIFTTTTILVMKQAKIA